MESSQVFDITKRESLDHLAVWLRDLKAHADPNLVICVAGNKADLLERSEEAGDDAAAVKYVAVDEATVQAFVTEAGATYFRTSAQSGQNITELFESLAVRVVDAYKHTIVQRSLSDEVNELNLGAREPSSTDRHRNGCC